jgi:5-methylcytosine-specific restriction protein A
MPNRPSAAKRGYGRRWQKVRLLGLKREPFCAECGVCVGTGINAIRDHIVPHDGDYDLMWNPENHQTLCKQCHDRKGGFGHG